MPNGMQDGAAGLIRGGGKGSKDGTLGNFITTNAFTSRPDSKSAPYCCGVRGFKDFVHAVDVQAVVSKSASNADYVDENDTPWMQLPPIPGGGRAGHKCVSRADHTAMYCVGGFKYTPLTVEQMVSMGMTHLPREKVDTGSLRMVQSLAWIDDAAMANTDGRAAGRFAWKSLEPLPGWQGVEPGVCIFDPSGTLFVIGGAEYTPTGQQSDLTQAASSGQATWSLGVNADSSTKWRQLPSLPGTPRFNHAVTCHQGRRQRVFVIGGATSGSSDNAGVTSYSTVLDNWVYDVEMERWKTLPETPRVTGNWRMEL